jgi:hypothetical protein
MTGVVFHGVGTVWDAARSRVLCRFTDGVYETSNPREVEILAGLGYDYERPKIAPIESKHTEPVAAQEADDEAMIKRPRGRPRNA